MTEDNLTLVVLAAGMGSRYGGLKQVDPIGPNGEIIIDYSLYDAKQAGFTHVVFVIRKDIEEVFKQKIGERAEKNFRVSYVYQELNKELPTWFSVPAERKKPWGTGQAILLCKDVVFSNFAVINSDDFYGRDAFIKMADALKGLSDDPDLYHYVMVGYRLKNTLSDFGSVSRGVCRISDEGYLMDITERTKIQKFEDGIKYEENGEWFNLTGEETVSMNFFGFTPSIFYELETRFYKFLMNIKNPEKDEFFIPEVVGQLIREGKAQVTILPTEAKWFGVTYPEDKTVVAEGIKNLIKEGVYPEHLFEEASSTPSSPAFSEQESPDEIKNSQPSESIGDRLILSDPEPTAERLFESQKQSEQEREKIQDELGPIKEAVYLIEVEKIKPNPYQPRKNFEEESLKELADSIKEFGILQPLIVSRVEKETP